MDAFKLTVFALAILLIIYSLNSAIAGKFKRVNPKQALLYVTTVAMIGIFGEIFLDSAYNFFVGHPLWYYRILPIQGGYTSAFAVVTWGLYGLHLYLLHGSLADRWSISKTRHLALIFSLEALVFEALLTIGARLYLGRYMYYYLPGDLWHVSSFQNIPFYFICGVVILKSLKRFRLDPVFYSGMAIFLTSVVVFLTK